MKKIVITLLALIIVVSLFFFNKGRREAVFYPMGGIPFKVIAYDRSRLEFRKDLQAVKKRVEQLELVFNSYLAASEISQLNQAQNQKPIQLSPDLERVLRASKNWWQKTEGSFDVTVGPLIELWQQAGKKNKLPDEKQIAHTRQLTGSNNFSLNHHLIFLASPQLKIGLGGIAKGDIIDQIVNLLQKRGIKRGLVDAGGDIRAFGADTFNFGIKNPIPGSAEILGKIKIPAGAIVTSGNYERYSEIAGKRYSHILDPRTGWPVNNTLVAATVIASQAIDADALATALMVMGKDQALNFLKKNKDFQGILVEKNGDYSVWVSADLKPKLELEDRWKKTVHIFDK